MSYNIIYRIKLALGLYGHCYAIYSHYGEPEWSCWGYLVNDFSNHPAPIISFVELEDAWAYLDKYPQLFLYIRRERYIP